MDAMPAAATHAADIRLEGATLGWNVVGAAVAALAAGHRADESAVGLAWAAATVVVMLALARGKHRVGNAVILAEARVTGVDAVLVATVATGLLLDAAAGLWWADATVGLVVAGYAACEARALLGGQA